MLFLASCRSHSRFTFFFLFIPKIKNKKSKIKKVFPYFLCLMKYAIETDMSFKEAATFSFVRYTVIEPTLKKQPNKLLLCAHPPGQPHCMWHIWNCFYTESSLSLLDTLLQEEDKGQVSVSILNYLVLEQDQKSNLKNNVLSMDIALLLH